MTSLKSEMTSSCFIIGVPLFCHTSYKNDIEVELQLVKAGINMFIEKPISVQPPEEILTKCLGQLRNKE